MYILSIIFFLVSICFIIILAGLYTDFLFVMITELSLHRIILPIKTYLGNFSLLIFAKM